MEITQRLASAVGDVVSLFLGEDLPVPVEQTIKQYPHLFIC